MTLQELLPELSKLTVADKVEIIKRLTQEVAQQSATFVPGAVYEVWSPYDSGEAAAQLQKMLDDHPKDRMADLLRLEYSQLTGMQGEVTLRPLLPLTLTLNEATIETTGLLDTGADINVLPYRVSLMLGANWDEQPLLATLSGNLARYEAKGLKIFGTIGIFEPVPLVFAWSRSEEVPLILGQVNLFQEFDICFFRAEGAFEVRPRRFRS